MNSQHLNSNKNQYCSLIVISQALRQTKVRFQTDSITSFLELGQLLCSDSKSVCIPTWKAKSDDLCILSIILFTPWSSVPDMVDINLGQASTTNQTCMAHLKILTSRDDPLSPLLKFTTQPSLSSQPLLGLHHHSPFNECR